MADVCDSGNDTAEFFLDIALNARKTAAPTLHLTCTECEVDLPQARQTLGGLCIDCARDAERRRLHLQTMGRPNE